MSTANGWKKYRRKAVWMAKRMSGPFCVETDGHSYECEDGYIVLGPDGNRHAVMQKDFEASFAEIPENSSES